MSTCVMTARPQWLLSHGYSVFVRLGLRSMVVVDDDGAPVGLVTRLTLMPWWHHMQHDGSRREQGHRHTPECLPSVPISTHPSEIDAEMHAKWV